MPPVSELIFPAVLFVGVTVAFWEGLKDGVRSYRERNSTWISFKTLEGAKEAARRVDAYYGDSGKRAEAVVAWLRSNPRIEVRVPNAMITGMDFKAAVDRFRYEVEKTEKSND